MIERSGWSVPDAKSSWELFGALWTGRLGHSPIQTTLRYGHLEASDASPKAVTILNEQPVAICNDHAKVADWQRMDFDGAREDRRQTSASRR